MALHKCDSDLDGFLTPDMQGTVSVTRTHVAGKIKMHGRALRRRSCQLLTLNLVGISHFISEAHVMQG